MSLFIGVPLGKLGRVWFARHYDSERRAPEMEHLSLRELC